MKERGLNEIIREEWELQYVSAHLVKKERREISKLGIGSRESVKPGKSL